MQGAAGSEASRLALACANVADLLAVQAASRADAIALVQPATDPADVRRELTWAELDGRVDAVAAGLSGRGLRVGQRVGLCAANGIDFVVCYLAALRCGLLAVPINPRSATGEVVRVLADSRCRLVVADAATAPTVRAAVGGLVDALAASSESVRAATPVPQLVVTAGPVLPGDRLLEELASAGGRVASPVDPESLAVLLHTSGTSGRPRAAMLTHRALLANVAQLAAIEPPVLGPDDVVLGLLPLFHVYGLNAVLGQVLSHGARLVLVERFDAEETLAVVEAEQVTNLPVVPAVIAAWAGRDDLAERLRSVRLAVSGAAPLEPELAALFTEQTGVRLEQGYGLTECAPVVTSTLVAAATRQPLPPAAERSSVGAPLPGVSLRIVDTGGHVLEPGDVGEVCVHGDNLFSGYWPDRHDGPDAEGWWRTGDLGLLDPDGRLELVDRLRELVIVSGFNVYPFEVEEVISEVPGVAGAAVIGVADADTGEAVVAYIVLSPDAASAEKVVDSVRSHCAERLARFKWPRTVNVVSGLPYSATGKVAKGRLRAQARRELLGLK
ncbi:MAG TPA: AMP-binding protein [Nocardioidaceae bacterium]|nr:AMP-binding protein [Nocardioidaceae bacterium]